MNLPVMKKLVSTWLLLTSLGMLTLSIAVSGATETPSSTPPSGSGSGGDTQDRPALRGPRALGPFTLFDTDHDGTLSAEEIANASAALRKLDKNGDGKLTSGELRPSRPPRERGDEGGREGGDMPPAPPET